MFSILMAGDDEAWAVPVGEEHEDSFPLSRYLEYTDPALGAVLKPVSAQTLEMLAGLPTLFMSELSGDPEGGASAGRHGYVTMRSGGLSGLSVARGSIHYRFVIENDFGKVPIDDRRAFEAALSLGRLELTRTHWAVKDGDLRVALEALGIEAHAPVAAAPQIAPLTSSRDEPPAIASVEDYLALILGKQRDQDREVFYRGHADYRFQLEPSLLRKNGSGGFRYYHEEA